MNSQSKNRIKLLAMALLFFAPFFIALAVYYGPDEWKPGGHTAHGNLLDPARPLPEVAFQLADGSEVEIEKLWTLMHIATAPCAEECKQRLWQTRQMRKLLHRRRTRVQRAILLDQGDQATQLSAELKTEHPLLKLLTLSDADRLVFDQWLGQLPVKDPVLLIDPLGNFLMFYGDELPLKGMLSDIKRVLKLSNIG